MSFSDGEETKRLLKKLSCYNAPIAKPEMKHFNNVDMLRDLPFYNELIIFKKL